MVQPAGDPVPVVNVVEEQRRGGGPAAVIAIGDRDAAHAAGDCDLGEPALLGRIAVVRREHACFPGGKEDVRKLETLGLVQGHQLHATGRFFIGAAGGEGGMVEKARAQC